MMDDIIEFVLEFILEGAMEICSNKKVPKYIRYPIIFIIALLFSLVIFGILFIGLMLLKESILGELVIIFIDLLLIIFGIIKFKKVYCNIREK